MLKIDTIRILENTFYKVYSDSNKYIKQISTGMITTEINTSIPQDFIETDIEIEVE